MHTSQGPNHPKAKIFGQEAPSMILVCLKVNIFCLKVFFNPHCKLVKSEVLWNLANWKQSPLSHIEQQVREPRRGFSLRRHFSSKELRRPERCFITVFYFLEQHAQLRIEKELRDTQTIKLIKQHIAMLYSFGQLPTDQVLPRPRPTASSPSYIKSSHQALSGTLFSQRCLYWIMKRRRKPLLQSNLCLYQKWQIYQFSAYYLFVSQLNRAWTKNKSSIIITSLQWWTFAQRDIFSLPFY